MTTLTDHYQYLRIQGATDADLAPLRLVIKSIKAEADKAWDHASTSRVKLDDLNAEYWRGKAHAFCAVLGDQAALSHMGAFDA